MAVQIGAKPDSGFDDPLGMLKDCHRRIESFLGVLCRVADRAGDGSLTPEEQSAVHRALDYFRVGGQRHTQDEEESLFPRMHQAGAAANLAAIEQLEHEHRDADRHHALVDRLFSQWIASGALPQEEQQQLRSAADHLRSLYAGHIRVEEETVFPRAAEILNRDAIAAIGAEFRARRASSSS